VQAIFGFFRMLFTLLKQKPDYFAIARDSPKQTIRKEQFSEYKANRTKLPDEFKYQM
jgi:DNA polymerase-1